MTMLRTSHRHQPLALAVALALGVNLAQAASVTVASPGDTDTAVAGTCTLRQAINTMYDGASAGDDEGNCRTNAIISPDDFGTNDKIVFDPYAVPSDSTITLNNALGLGALAVSNLSYTLTIQGTGQTIDADHYSGVLVAQNDVGLTLSSLTLTNGYAETGGGINAYDTNLTLNHVAVINNTASGVATLELAAGIFLGGGGSTLTLNHSTVSNNILNAYGGGSGVGAGLFAKSAQVTLNQTTVSNNTLTQYATSARYGSGGVYLMRSPTSIIDSTISGNSASGGDDVGIITGGVYAFDSSLSITNSTISGNSVTCGFGAAGALSVSGDSTTLTNTTVSKNLATATSDAIHDSGGVLVGAFDSATLTLDNTILSGNSVNGPNYDLYVFDGSTASASASLLGSVLSGTGLGSGNLYYDDPYLSPLADNGGPTKTMALIAGSPAIDAGNDSVCAAAPVNDLDQRGVTRPQGAHCDIGAFEFDGIFANGFESGP